MNKCEVAILEDRKKRKRKSWNNAPGLQNASSSCRLHCFWRCQCNNSRAKVCNVAFTSTGKSNIIMWDPELSITEPEADTASRNAAVAAIRIVKTGPDTFHVLLKLTWRKHEVFLCTTRARKEPRQFKHLGRLIEYIEEHFPTISELTMTLAQPQPPIQPPGTAGR